jgi:drug/metabolite transporter (DMT)-like permease
MTKIILVLLVGLVFESVGVVLLKEGIDSLCKGKDVTLATVLPVVLKGITHPKIILGVFFEALFFVCLLYLMSKKDISFLWPLTSLSFVFATIAAVLYLKEKVDLSRWIGVALIMVGAGIITWNEKHNEQTKTPQPSAAMENSPATKP